MQKRPSKVKDIVARSITLTDSKGKAKIYLGVSDGPTHSTICIFGDGGRSIQISADAEGGLCINLNNGAHKVIAGICISADDAVGIGLYDHRSGTSTEMGSDGTGLPHHITMRHHGKVNWTTRKKTQRKKPSVSDE